MKTVIDWFFAVVIAPLACINSLNGLFPAHIHLEVNWATWFNMFALLMSIRLSVQEWGK